LGKTYVTRLARATSDRKRAYDVKLRLPTELAKKLGMKHGTEVVLRLRGGRLVVEKKRGRGRGPGKPVPQPPISS
jgi:hypothetical protein